MKKGNRIKSEKWLFQALCFLIVFMFVFSPVLEAGKNPGIFPCFRIDVPNHWTRYQSGPGEWHFHAHLPFGARIWLMLLVFKVDPAFQSKGEKKLALTGSSPQGPDWITGRIPIQTNSGKVWECMSGVYPSGREHITFSINLYEPDGYGLAAAAFVLGTDTFLKGKWTSQHAAALRNVLASLRITKGLKKCGPQKTGPLMGIPLSLSNLAMSGKRGYVGAEFKNAPPGSYSRTIPGTHLKKHLNQAPGVVVTQITPGSPFVAAGVQKGDRIWKADDWPLNGYTNFMQVLYWKNKGESVKLQIDRNGRNLVAEVQMAGLEDLRQKTQRPPVKTGVSLDTVVRNNPPQAPSKTAPPPPQEASSLNIQGIRMDPAQVKGGEKFTFIVELTVHEADKNQSHLAIEMAHEILKDGEVLYKGTPETIRVPNGTPYRLKKSLKSARKTGSYQIEVTLSYAGLKKTVTGALEIE